tara:strand:- start:458 stop:1480 length:1023 start_codon:yes stop_codon:yes gene_type:complete
MAVGFKRKKTTSPMEAIRRLLSKDGLSASDKKDLAKFKKKQDAAIAKAKADKKATAKKRMMADAPAGKGGKAAKIIAASKPKVKDTAPKGKGGKAAGVLARKAKAKKMMANEPKGAGGKAAGVIKSQKMKALEPKGKAPRSVSAAQKAGKLYFMDKNNKPKLAITAEQLTKFMKAKGIKSRKEALTKFANTYKPGTGMAKFKADMKKMAMGGAMMKKKGMARGGMKKGYAMGGSMKKKGMARGGMKKKGMAVGGAMKKKGMARGGMKKKGYAMGGLKATNPSQVGLRKLPQSVRNKMGYMKKGGMTKKGYAKGGSMKKKGYAMGGVAKKYGIVDNRKNKR